MIILGHWYIKTCLHEDDNPVSVISCSSGCSETRTPSVAAEQPVEAEAGQRSPETKDPSQHSCISTGTEVTVLWSERVLSRKRKGQWWKLSLNPLWASWWSWLWIVNGLAVVTWIRPEEVSISLGVSQGRYNCFAPVFPGSVRELGGESRGNPSQLTSPSPTCHPNPIGARTSWMNHQGIIGQF